MKHRTHNRIVSVVLCSVAALTVLLLCVFAVTNEQFAVTHGGEIVTQVVFSQDEKTEVSLQGIPEGAQLQWQIRMEEGEGWVDITGQTESALTLSYALIANIMDQTGSTAVRCVATVSGEEIVTAPVEVKMSFIIDSSLSQAPVNIPQNTENGGVMLLAATTYVEVRIEYVDEYGNKMFDPYIAYLESDTPFEATVKSPSRLGYGAYTDGTVRDEHLGYPNKKPDALSVTLNYASVTENKTVRVVYFKVPVKYTVRYFLQNVNNDLYTEDSDLYFIGEGLEGDYPKDSIEIDIAGFTPLYHQPAEIAADGSTEFEVRYDRNYYLINFQLEGGYGVDPVYARYETPFVVSVPIKHGYRFAGWDLVSTKDADGNITNYDGESIVSLPGTVPHENQTYKAIWVKVDTQYTVVFWKADLDDGDNTTPITYSYWGQVSVDATSDDRVSGTMHQTADSSLTDYQYFTYNETVTEEKELERTDLDENNKVIVEGDGSTVVNVYYSRKIYTIRFIYAEHWLANSTGCGQYNGEYNPNVDHNGNASGAGHSPVYWNFKVSELPEITDPYYQDASRRGSFTEHYDWGDPTFYYIALSAEFGANIEAIWPDAAIGSIGNYYFGSWGAQCESEYRKYNAEHANIVGPYPVMSAEMIIDPNNPIAQNMVAWWGQSKDNISAHAYHIYYEVLPNQPYDVVKDGKYYKLDRTHEFTAAHNGNTRVDPFYYNGYTIIASQKNGYSNSRDSEFYHKDCALDPKKQNHDYCNNFYYNRNEYTLTFFNHAEGCDTFPSEKLKFQEPISSALPDNIAAPYTPPYPDKLEPDAYIFAGWYKTANFLTGTEVTWSGGMPDSNMSLYAKWEPVVRRVEFYYTLDDLKNGNQWSEQNPITVTHGKIITTGSVEEPTREGYTFVGWFYIDETGAKKAFSLYEMEVRQDLKLYAEWHSEIRTEYIVYYKIQGTNTSIALPDQEYIFAGLTKTFVAKAGTHLFPAYQGSNAEGKMYFPVTNSHSILMYPYEIADDGTDVIPQNNKYTFEYIFIAVPNYTVKYVDAQTGLPVAPEKTVLGAEHKAAVVTEQFVYVDNYLPDSAHKRLVLSANEDENVITFYYTKQNTDEPGDSGSGTPTPPGKTYYKVTHYIQNLDGTTYSEYTSYEKIGEFGTTVEAEYLTIAGFEAYEGHTDTVKKAVLTKPTDENGDGIVEDYKIVELKLYYNRLSYPYEVRYLDNTTQKPVSPTKNSVRNLPYGTSVTETAIELSGYNLVGSVTKEIIIGDKVQETDAKGNKHYNIITFYYSEKKADIFYHAVCTSPVATNFGHVSPTLEAQVTSSNIQGSTATAYSGFRFVGWFEDSTCVTPVPETWVGGTKIVPQIDMQNMEGSYSFYALFEPIPTDLTIKKTGVADDCTDNFIFHVQGVAGTVTEHVDLYITINGNGSVVIPDVYCGLYIITELRWSYQYKPDQTEKNVTVLEDPTKNVVTFKNDYIGSDWLGGEDSIDNVFTGVYSPHGE